jgi:hypothetical protein
MDNNHLSYEKTSESFNKSRVMVVMPSAELDAIDQRGVPAGCRVVPPQCAFY